MKLVPLRDNPQFLKGFYLRTRFPGVLFEPGMAVVGLAGVVIAWYPTLGWRQMGGPLAFVSAGMVLFLIILQAPVVVIRMAMLERQEGTLDLHRASPQMARDFIIGLLAGGAFPEWMLVLALSLVFLPSAATVGIPWHLALAFPVSCAMTGALLAAAGAVAGMNIRGGQRGTSGVFAVTALGFYVWFIAMTYNYYRFRSLWVHATGFPALGALLAGAGDDTGFGAAHSATLLLLQSVMQLPLFLLCWMSLWRVFRGPRWHNSRKLRVAILSAFLFLCLIPDGTRFWLDQKPVQLGGIWNWPDPEAPQGNTGTAAFGSVLAMALMLGVMAVGSPTRGEVARGIRRARKMGVRPPFWMDDRAINTPAMLAVAGISLSAQAVFSATGITRLSVGAAFGVFLLCINLFWMALSYQCMRLGWGTRARTPFLLWIVVVWTVLPAVAYSTVPGMLLSPWLPMALIFGSPEYALRSGFSGVLSSPIVWVLLAVNGGFTVLFAAILRRQYRNILGEASGHPDGTENT